MPIGPIIGEGLGIVGSIVNANNQREMNDQNWIRQAQMYQQQRADALADRDYNNVYNSPAEQMKRLKAAGLNPNLVYGTGSQVAASQMPRGASPGGPQGIAPRIDLSGIGNSFVQMYQMGVMQAQQKSLDSLALLNATRERNEYWKGRSSAAGAILNEAKIPFAGAMAQNASDLLGAQYWKTNVEGNIASLHEQILTELVQKGQPVQKALNDLLIQQNILNKSDSERKLIDQKLKTEEFQTQIKDFEARMANGGITKNDPLWLRSLMGLLRKFGIDVPLY